MNKFKRVALGAVALVAAGSASAAGIDTTAVTAALGETGTAVAQVGAAVVVVAVGVKVWKWLQRAL